MLLLITPEFPLSEATAVYQTYRQQQAGRQYTHPASGHCSGKLLKHINYMKQ